MNKEYKTWEEVQAEWNEKYKDDIVPRWLPEEQCYVVRTALGVEMGDATYITDYFCWDSPIYHFRNKYHQGDYPDHEHEFSGVLAAIIDEPETFTFEGYEEEYSLQQRACMHNLQDLILETRKTGVILSKKEVKKRRKYYENLERGKMKGKR